MIEAHGGKMWAESAGEGKGATFTFTLPKRKEIGLALPDKILVVDDEPDIRLTCEDDS